MAICSLCDKDGNPNWCERHQRFHNGHYRRYALDPNEKGERYRRFWDSDRFDAIPLTHDPKVSLIRKTLTYAKARTRWEKAGRPVVPDDIKGQRRAICNSCPHRDKEQDVCKICGCSLGVTLLGDKLAWATEACPKNKWGTWTKPLPPPPPPPDVATAEFATIPPMISVAFSVRGMEPLDVNLPLAWKKDAEIWRSHSLAPVWGRAEEGEDWYSPFDWTVCVSRLKMDGPLRRFVVSFERFTPTGSVRIIAAKLQLLSLTPFLATVHGTLGYGTQGSAVSPYKRLFRAPWSITVTEAQ